MKLNKKITMTMAAGIVAAALASPASAQVYVGGGIGQSSARGADGSTVILGVPVSATGGNSRETSWKIFAGYQITPTWGVEGQYTDLGDRDYSVRLGAPINQTGGASVKTNQWGLAGTGTIPFGNGFSLFGKLGVSRNHIGGGNVTIAGITAPLGGENKTSLLAGIGAGYAFNKQLGIRVEYENFGKMSSNGGFNNGSIRADAWSLSLKYGF